MIDDSSIEGRSLYFNPEKYLYSTSLIDTRPFWGDAVTGIIKYQGYYYIYNIKDRINGSINIWLWRKDGASNYKFYGARKKEITK